MQTVRNWRERNTVPSAKGLKAIHDKLGFAYDWLISGEGERFDAAGEKIERLEKENARLLAMVHFDGRSAEESSPDTARAAGQE